MAEDTTGLLSADNLARRSAPAISGALHDQIVQADPHELHLYALGVLAGQKWNRDRDGLDKDGRDPQGIELTEAFWRGVLDATGTVCWPPSAGGEPKLTITSTSLLLDRFSEFLNRSGALELFQGIQRVLDKRKPAKGGLYTVAFTGMAVVRLFWILYEESTIGRFQGDWTLLRTWRPKRYTNTKTAPEAFAEIASDQFRFSQG